jgi:hypothetical protein
MKLYGVELNVPLISINLNFNTKFSFLFETKLKIYSLLRKQICIHKQVYDYVNLKIYRK